MRSRSETRNSTDRRVFARTARRVKQINISPVSYRGGYRL